MIPIKIREQLSRDIFMQTCIHKYLEDSTPCDGRITWEHAFVWAGRQINEVWAIVPVCFYHHLDAGLLKDYNRYTALLRASNIIPEVTKKYPKHDWAQELKFYEYIYGKRTKKDKIPPVPKM